MCYPTYFVPQNDRTLLTRLVLFARMVLSVQGPLWPGHVLQGGGQLLRYGSVTLWPPLPWDLQLSLCLWQQWACRYGELRTFWKTISQGDQEYWQRLVLTLIPGSRQDVTWRWQGMLRSVMGTTGSKLYISHFSPCFPEEFSTPDRFNFYSLPHWVAASFDYYQINGTWRNTWGGLSNRHEGRTCRW